MGKKDFLMIIGFVILLIAIPATAYLVRHNQIFKSRAASALQAQFIDASGNPISTTSDRNVRLKVTAAVGSSSLLLDPRIGISHARGQYPAINDTGDGYLLYGARDARSLGFQAIEIYIGTQDVCSKGDKFPNGFYQTMQGCLPPITLTDLTAVVKSDKYNRLLNMDFKTFFLTADGATDTAHSYFINKGFTFTPSPSPGASPAPLIIVTKLHDEFFNLTQYLLATFGSSNKTIILQTPNEMDWDMLTGQDPSLEPSQTAIGNAITYWNTIQKAVDEAKAANPGTALKIYHACEVNLVVKGTKVTSATDSALIDDPNKATAANSVVPNTHCDLYGYSAYDSIFDVDTTKFGRTFAYLKQKAPDSPAFGANNVYVSELGIPQQGNINMIGADRGVTIVRNTIHEALNQNSPYVLFWQLYDNECPVFNPNPQQQPNCPGYWIREPSLDSEGKLNLSPIYTQYLLPTFKII